MKPTQPTASRSFLAQKLGWLLEAPQAYVFLVLYVALTALGAFLNQRSLPVFLAFEASLLLIFYARIPAWPKALLGAAVLLVLLPVLGLRNVYYLEVATQIGIYVALALGLNIVVGFAGLLDLGYVAFYAVGAYVWAIFGSAHANEFAAPGSLLVAAIGLLVAVPGAMLVHRGLRRLVGFARAKSVYRSGREVGRGAPVDRHGYHRPHPLSPGLADLGAGVGQHGPLPAAGCLVLPLPTAGRGRGRPVRPPVGHASAAAAR